jgi:hypothetical protein
MDGGGRRKTRSRPLNTLLHWQFDGEACFG